MVEEFPTIVVNGLSPYIVEQDIAKVMNDLHFGECKIQIDRDQWTGTVGETRITFRQSADAERFYATINNGYFLGTKPFCDFSNTSGSKPIVLKHIPLNVNSHHIYELARKFGRLISCIVMVDRNGLECYAILQFEFQVDGEKCVAGLNGYKFNGSPLHVAWKFARNSPYQYPVQPPPDQPQNSDIPTVSTTSSTLSTSSSDGKVSSSSSPIDKKNLYVKNLDENITTIDLFNLFKIYGNVQSVKVMCDERGKSKGFGFVSFVDEISAEHALDAMHGDLVAGKYLCVYVAEPRKHRQGRLQKTQVSESSACSN